jgi:hypothetical protein
MPLSIHQFLTGNNIYCVIAASLLSQPITVWLLAVPQLKERIEGKHFDTVEDTISDMTGHLWIIPKEDF